MPLCEVLVGGGVIAFTCDLARGHEGPHRSAENAKSVRERDQWESAQRGEPQLSEFQGEAQTTAERYTANPTPVPGTGPYMAPGVTVICDPCLSGDHNNCRHRAEIIAVEFSGKERVEFFCYCFQTAPVPHGLDQEFAGKHGWPLTTEIPVFTKAPQVASAQGPGVGGAGGATLQSVTNQPTKQRDGDQSLPQVHEGERSIQDRIVDKISILKEQGDLPEEAFRRIEQRMEESKNLGIQRYGTPLQAWNGRDFLEDLIGEIRDTLVYLTGIQEGRESSEEVYVRRVMEAMEQFVQEGGKLTGRAAAEIAVRTIFNATAPVLAGD